MTAAPELTAELRKLVLEVEEDLRERLAGDPENLSQWQGEHEQALKAERTSSSWEAWRDDRVTQSAVAWVLTTVFVRFCEDNALISRVWITGTGGKRQEALDAELDYFRRNPEHTYRDWTLQAVEHLKAMPATHELVESHSPLWQVQPSGAMAKNVLDFWRETGSDGRLLRDFNDPGLSTRFLGDLYQDLSEHAKKTFALLQTPEFVEEFILDQTLTPALKERPLDGFRLIDPTCGSGHFLLGAFHRLLDAWAAHAPGLERRVRVQKALDCINGVDLNPFAIAISRFRLTVAALRAEGSASLENAAGYDYRLAAGDSLLFGKTTSALPVDGFDLDGRATGFAYSSEDLDLLESILAENQYDVVVGNPPYITVKDRTLNERYRGLYKTSKGKYALTVPFMERFFGLAKHGINGQTAGWTGQITSNSFMKREVGSKIIEDYLSRQDLRLVADTSGAYIPGHGTPTVIIVGRHQRPVGSTVRSVLGVRSEPERPDEPEKGLVWQAIINNIDAPNKNDPWVTVTDLPRSTLATHPWSLSGGGASDLLAAINSASESLLRGHTKRIGVFGIMGSDDAMMLEHGVAARTGREQEAVAQLVLGDAVRDFSVSSTVPAWFPYNAEHELLPLDRFPGWSKCLWAVRTELGNRATFTKGTYFSDGRPFYEWHQLPKDGDTSPLTITFAFVTTHNHFVLDRGGQVFKQSAPVIKLPAGASEDEHMMLLGLLNSSTACFWLKQNSHKKAGALHGGGSSGQSWTHIYEFTGTTLLDFPIPAGVTPQRARRLDALAAQASAVAKNILKTEVPTLALLALQN